MKSFISEDPIQFAGGMNWYSYVGNRPTNGIDPLGLHTLHFTSPYPAAESSTLMKGELVIYDDEGNLIDSFAAVSGAYGKGRLPGGYYKGYKLELTDQQGMVVDGFGWKLYLSDSEDKLRDALRVHADEDPFGTAGCIGIRERHKELYELLKKLKRTHDFLDVYVDGPTDVWDPSFLY
jgi:hypothetical protein